ncbi:MAG: PAS domain-containing protein, partial [Ktedonobacteraceae bacterium]|nr:PAS domain-containing protein [Ktedonobacteraceae bacterium]
MEPGLAEHLTYILGSVPVGVAVLDSTNLRILYINPYLQAYLEEGRDVVGQPIAEVLPAEIYHAAVPLLQQVSSTGEAVRLEEVPFEGFLEVRGRTYWRITISCMPAGSRERLLITIEDVTEVARARLHLNAIHHISATIADASGVPRVLDRILQAL